jgi:hypothetical protein
MENEKGFQPSRLKALNLVGTPRFELGASPTPRVRATRLRHVPLLQSYYPAKAQLSNRAENVSLAYVTWRDLDSLSQASSATRAIRMRGVSIPVVPQLFVELLQTD